VRWLLAFATGVSLLLVLQNYALEIFPGRHVSIPFDEIRPYSSSGTFAYIFDFDGSEPDRWPNARSRLEFFEDGTRYRIRTHVTSEVVLAGGDRFAHEPGRVIFSSTDNTDPRKNGRKYSLLTPVLYSPAIGVPAMVLFLFCTSLWFLLCKPHLHQKTQPDPTGSHWRWHLAAATALFLLGLYCNTGSLPPYAITSSPWVSPDTGYAYNQDHRHYRVLFDFVNGSGRSVWDHALFLRRILFGVLGWPLMRAFGFELGGTLTALILNVAALIAAVLLIRRWIGERAAILAGWILAIYPGAAYWGCLPYSYSLIFPGSILLVFALWRLTEGARGIRLSLLSLSMGFIYLGYDFAPIFVPATFVALCWRRRFAAAMSSVALQLLPEAIWILSLAYFFGQPLRNPNSGIYQSAIAPYLHPSGFVSWCQEAVQFPGAGFDVFFAANFIFLPALFLFVLAANPFTSRIRFHISEAAPLLAAAALFSFLNLAPGQSGSWQMSGTWISRLYQPIFPVLVIFIARWWQDLPPIRQPSKTVIFCALGVSALGNLLVIFGPILGNPGRISEYAFYRFYDHTDSHFAYESNMNTLGRRPIGFPLAGKGASPAPTALEANAAATKLMADQRALLESLRYSIRVNRPALAANLAECNDVARALANVRSALLSKRLELKFTRGEITAEEAKPTAKSWRSFVSPSLLASLDGVKPDTGAAEPAPYTEPRDLEELTAAIRFESNQLSILQGAIVRLQGEILNAESDLTEAQNELRQETENLTAAKR
jgi:hypothetical protein